MSASDQQTLTVACHIAYSDGGRVVNVVYRDNQFVAVQIPSSAATALEPSRRPIYLGATSNHVALTMDPLSGAITETRDLPLDAVPHYAYRDFDGSRLWLSNDGDDETGNDKVACPSGGAPILVIATGRDAQCLARMCIGRGHHVATFTFPTPDHPSVPKLAFVSNLLDGTISVFGNDPKLPQSFLKVIGAVDLIEPDKEMISDSASKNNAYPHGMVYSPVTGKIYNLNNGYGSITVIDPINLSILSRIALTKCSNLLLDPSGRYALAKGADRKANPDHVIGQLAVIDLTTEVVVTKLEIPDFYPSTFRFDPLGQKLYVTSAATGKGTQRRNLRLQSILVFDAGRLPQLHEIGTLEVGRADCDRRPLAFFPSVGETRFIFFPNPTDGTLSVFDARANTKPQLVALGRSDALEVLFSYWDGTISGS